MDRGLDPYCMVHASIFRAIKDQYKMVRFNATAALGRIGDHRAILLSIKSVNLQQKVSKPSVASG